MECPRDPHANSPTSNFLSPAQRRRRNEPFPVGPRSAAFLCALCGNVLATLFVLSVSSPLIALELNGVLIYSAEPSGELSGPVWHTASGYGGRPIGFTRWPPPGPRGMPFPQGPDASLRDREGRPALPLWPGSHVTHLFWQFRPGEFPGALVLNLYFNGNTFSPAISVLVVDRYGLTHFAPNPSPYTLAMDLSLAPNPQAAEFSDGATRARVTAAFFFSSSPSLPEYKQWRPTDFVNLDRVGTDSLAPDGLPDGILVFQLDVLPEQAAPAPDRASSAFPRLPLPPTSQMATFGVPVPGQDVLASTPEPPLTMVPVVPSPFMVSPVLPTSKPTEVSETMYDAIDATQEPTTPASPGETPEPTPHPPPTTVGPARTPSQQATSAAKPTSARTFVPTAASPQAHTNAATPGSGTPTALSKEPSTPGVESRSPRLR